MTRSHELIIQDICDELQPLKRPEMDIVAEITRRMELIPVMYSNPETGASHVPFADVKSIATAAELFRVEFQKDKLGCLLKKSMPMIFQILDEQFGELEKMGKGSGKRDIPKRFTAEIAYLLIQDYSLRPTAARHDAIAGLVHEYRTGERNRDDAPIELRRACKDVREGYAPPRYYPEKKLVIQKATYVKVPRQK